MAINPLQAPINYAVDVQSPFQAALGGLQIGAGLEQMDVARQKRAMEMQQLQAAQAGQAELRNLFNNPNATSADYARVSAFLPKDQAAIVTQGFERKTKEQQQADLLMGGEVYSAIKSGNIDVAKQRLTDKATALRNSGRESDAKAAENSLELINLNPTAAQATIGLYMSQLPGGKEFLENADKTLSTIRTEAEAPLKLREASAKAIVEEQKAKFAPEKFGLEINLTKSQIEQAQAAIRASDAAAKKSGADAERAEAEAKQMAMGVIPVDKRPEAETKIRAEYNNQTKPYQEVKSAYGRMLASEDTAVGDLSLIFGYMKMLDPGSVVREGEFATAQNAAGVPERILNVYNRVITGERLNASQRNSFKGQAKGLYNSALDGEKTVRTGLERIATGYGLNTNNIFYTATETAPAAAPAIAPAAPAAPAMPPGFRVIR